MEKCKEREELSQSEIYLLFGTSEENGENIVYIGQARARKNKEGILCRLLEHKRNPEKDYWTEAIAFTTSNNSLGPTEISYLENRFFTIASDAKRYNVKNINEPSLGNVTEEKESELEEFIDYAKIVKGALGYKVFEPLIQIQHLNLNQSENNGTLACEPLFVFERKTGIARGQHTSEGFVVLKGSIISIELQQSCPKNVRLLREKYADKIDSNGLLTTDLLFSSPSAAAGFVAGSSNSGNIAWKTSEGITLKDIDGI